MTEDSIQQMEIQVEYANYKVIVRANSWAGVLAQARVAKMKMRIAELTCREIRYDFTENQWHLLIPKEAGPVRNRIACALLLSFPVRMARRELVVLSSVNLGSLKNYLTKSELDVLPNIDENEEGIILNEQGYKWATDILESIEGNNDKEEEIEDDGRTDGES